MTNQHSSHDKYQSLSPLKQLDSIMRRACEERLFPAIVSSLEENAPQRLLMNIFRKKVRSQYSYCLRVPQVYKPGEQLTQWQKVQRKIRRITERRVPIEYLEMNRDAEGRFHPTFQGHELDQVPIAAKDDFKIFVQFNQKNFKRDAFDSIFDDRLELKQPQPIHNPYPHNRFVQKRKDLHPLPTISSTIEPSRYKIITNRLVTLESQSRTTKSRQRTNRIKTQIIQPLKQPSQESSTIFCRSPKQPEKRPRIYTNFEKILSGRVLSGDNIEQIIRVFNKIGGYSGRNNNELLTKESIVKYLKRYYEKPHRIVDFLEIPSVLNLETFRLLSKRLRVMQKPHFNFMTFVFYDTNHDGIICEGDLSRLQTLAKRHSILVYDYEKLIRLKQAPGINNTIENGLPQYMQLYNLPEITQSVIFEWFKTHNEFPRQETQMTENSILINSTAEAYSTLVGMYRKKYAIRFEKSLTGPFATINQPCGTS